MEQVKTIENENTEKNVQALLFGFLQALLKELEDHKKGASK